MTESQYLIYDKRRDLQQINFMMASSFLEAADDYKIYQHGYTLRNYEEDSLENNYYEKDLIESDETEWDIRVTNVGWGTKEIIESLNKDKDSLDIKYYKLVEYGTT